MADGRLATIKGYIVNVLSDDHYMEFIRNTYNKHSSFIGERYSNFGNTLSYILNISNNPRRAGYLPEVWANVDKAANFLGWRA